MKKYNVDFQTSKTMLAKEAGLKDQEGKSKRIHIYHDETGKPVYRKIIYKYADGNKSASFERYEGSKWIKGLGSTKRISYNLQHLKTASNILLCESEKDCDNLAAIGFTATTSGGAESWKNEFADYLQEKEIVIAPHNDEAGNNYAKKVAQSLKGKAKSIKILDAIIFGDLKGADISDWLDRGHTKEELLELIKAIPEWSYSPDIYTETKGLIDSLLKWNNILSLDVKTEYLLDKLIPKGSITMLFGRGGIGKTSLCLQISRTIAEGIPFAELQTIKTPVFYIDLENPLAVLKDRVEHIGNSENIFVWHLSCSPQPPKMDSKDWELYKQLPAGLMIFDTMRAANQSDEDKSKETALVMSRMKELREAGNTIIFLQHTPKGNENIYKGSTAWLDLADHVLSIEEVKGNEEERIEFDKENLYRFGTRIKTRYSPHHIYLRFNPDIKGFEIAKDPDIEVIEAIHELLSDKDELNTNQVYELVKKELDIKGKGQVIKLLKKGDGEYWDSEKKGRAVYYRSKVQPIYSETTRLINENGLKDSNSETSQVLDNSIESNSPEGIQTDRPINQCPRQQRCMLTPGQRDLCEVKKPCPKDKDG